MCAIVVRAGCDQDQHPPVASVKLELRLFRANSPDYWFEPASLEFLDCTYIASRVDLTELAGVGYQIAENSSKVDSDLRRHVESLDLNQPGSLRDYTEFSITLIYPAGEITIFARDFVLRTIGEAETTT